MVLATDKQGQKLIEWDRGAGRYARAWIMHRYGDSDWAGTGRYLNAAPIKAPGKGPAGTGLDFPIYGEQKDEDILRAYVASVRAVQGMS